MDIYQIIIDHNRSWTIREIIFFAVINVISVMVLYVLLKSEKITRTQAAAGICLILYLEIVFASTVFTRTPGLEHQCELIPFWSWREVLFHDNRPLLQENLLNILLLLPVGLCMPLVFPKKGKLLFGLFVGAAISGVIEVCQYVFCRGLFEWDDIIHNGIGCMIGCAICSFVLKRRIR